MISLTSSAHAHFRLRCVLGAIVVMLLGAPSAADAQVAQGVQKGAEAGNKAAGPVGGVLGGAIGGVVGVFTGVLGVAKGGGQAAPAASDSKQPIVKMTRPKASTGLRPYASATGPKTSWPSA